MQFRIKAGDTVAVIAGKDKGKVSKVLKVLRKESKVLVQNVNMLSHFQKARDGEGSGVFKKEAPIAISNVSHVDPGTSTPTRVFVKEENGKKLLCSKKSGKVIR